jgi:hypothetical protein
VIWEQAEKNIGTFTDQNISPNSSASSPTMEHTLDWAKTNKDPFPAIDAIHIPHITTPTPRG